MSFPSTDEFIALNKESGNKLIDLMVISSDEDDAEKVEPSPNLSSWEIVSVSSSLIEIKLTFEKPLEVSQGTERDKLVVQVSLSQFPDENQATLPE